MIRRLAVLSILFILSIAVISTVGVSTQNDEPTYRVVISGSVDTPERTFSVGDAEHRVSRIAERTPGERLAVDAYAPDGAQYSVYLYNSEGEVVDTKAATGDDSVAFETDELAPGTYVAAIYDDGDVRAVHPVVIAGYAVSLDAPTAAVRGSTATVAAQIEAEASDGAPHEVAVVLANEDTQKRVTLARQSDGEYRASVSLDGYATGEYSAYAVAVDDETVYGEPELLGISEAATLTVEPQATAAATATDSDPTDEGATGDETMSDATTFAQSETPTTERTRTETTPGQSTTESTTDSTTDGGVITPVPATTETPGQSGFGVTAIVAAVAALVWARRD